MWPFTNTTTTGDAPPAALSVSGQPESGRRILRGIITASTARIGHRINGDAITKVGYVDDTRGAFPSHRNVLYIWAGRSYGHADTWLPCEAERDESVEELDHAERFPIGSVAAYLNAQWTVSRNMINAGTIHQQIALCLERVTPEGHVRIDVLADAYHLVTPQNPGASQ